MANANEQGTRDELSVRRLRRAPRGAAGSRRFQRRAVTIASILSVLAGLVTVAANPLTAKAAFGDIIPFAGTGSWGFSGDGGPATSAEVNNPNGVAEDAAGNVYIADTQNHRIRKVDPSGTIITYAGNGSPGLTGDGGPAASAELNTPYWLSFDSAGDLLIADYSNNDIRAITPSGTISTVAGTGTAGFTGDGGAATSAEINGPQSVRGLSGGGFLIGDTNNNRVRKVGASGTITTIAGNGTGGFAGDGGAATSAELNSPQDAVPDSAGDVLVADCSNNRVRKVDPTGNMSTIAGTGTSGFSGDGGPATGADFNCPVGLVPSAGNLYVSDYGNGAIRKIDATGTITTIAGQGNGGINNSFNRVVEPWIDTSGRLFFADWWDGRVWVQNIADLLSLSNSAPSAVNSGQTFAYTLTVANPGGAGTATGATLSDPLPSSVSYVSATSSAGTCSLAAGTVTCTLGTLNPGNTVTVTITVTAPNTATSISNTASVTANETDPAPADNTATAVTGVNAADLSVSGTTSPANTVNAGALLTYTLTVQNLSPNVTATSVSLTNSLPAGVTLQSDASSQGSCTPSGGTVTCALGSLATGASATVTIGVLPSVLVPTLTDVVTVSASNPDPNTANNTATIQTAVQGALGSISAFAGTGSYGYSGDGGPATAANLAFPTGIVGDGKGDFYIADLYNYVIRKVDPSGTITTIAGNNNVGYSGDGGPATSAAFSLPHWLALDSSGNLLVTDDNNNVIRSINLSTGIISTVAGNHTAGYSGDGGKATSAELNGPAAVTALPGGGFLIADQNNNVIRKVDSSGTITRFAGTGTAGLTGNGGPATSAELNSPQGMAVDAAGNVFIADVNNNEIRKVDASGTITDFAGNGSAGYSGDGGAALSASLNAPVGVVAAGGAIFFTDYANDVVREVTANGTISTVAGNGSYGNSGDGGPALQASFARPQELYMDSSANLYVANTQGEEVREVSTIGPDLLHLTASSPNTVAGGALYTYTYSIANPGSVGGATGVTLSASLVSGVGVSNISSTQGSCALAGLSITCALGAVPAFGTATVTVYATAPATSTAATTTATLTQNELDPALGDNTASVTTYVDSADVSVAAAVSAPNVQYGQLITFTLTVANAGPVTATGVTLTSSLSSGLSLMSTPSSQGSCTTASSTVTCTLGTLATGGSATATIGVVAPYPVSSATASASVSADQVDQAPANNTATATAAVASVVFQQFGVGRFESPQALAFGTDSNAYVAESTFDREITQMNINGDITHHFSVTDYNENFVTRGPDGNIWFTESSYTYNQGLIGRLTPSGVLTEFTLPTPWSRPYAIAAGGDGNVWFTEDGSAIGRITPQGVVTEFPIPTQQPLVDAIALGPDGNIWFTESRTDRIARIDASGHVTEFDLPSGAGPEGLVTGPDHNLWVVESGSNNIGRFNISTHALTEYPIPTANSEAEYIAVGPDANLYFTEANFYNQANQEQGVIGRISTTGTIAEFTIPNSSQSEPWDIVAGPDGKMWFTEEFGHAVANMTIPVNAPGTQAKGTSSIVHLSAHQPPPVPQLNLPLSFGGPLQATRGVDGNLYTYAQGTSAIGRISPGGTFTSFPAPSPSVGTMATGSDGNIWYCDNNNGLNRFNPTTGVTTNFPTPSPYDCHDVVAGADGDLWYDNPGAGVFGKMTTSGVATEFPFYATPLGGPGGSIWITNNNNFERLNPDGTAAATYPIPSQLVAGNLSVAGTTGTADGNLWFSAEMQDPTQGGPYFGIVGRLNVTTGKIDTFKTGIRGSSSQIQGITAAPDANLYAAFGGNGTGPAGILVMNTSGQILSKQLVPAGYATPYSITVGPSFTTTNRKGWAVYMGETATDQFAVIQGNGS